MTWGSQKICMWCSKTFWEHLEDNEEKGLLDYEIAYVTKTMFEDFYES